MKYYLCKFMKNDPQLSMTNTYDVVGHICTIYSDDDLLEIPSYLIKDYYEIKEILDEYNCEDIILDPITEDEFNNEWKNVEHLYINKRNM